MNIITGVVYTLASVMCRVAERGGQPCYQCKDAAARLLLGASIDKP